MILSLAVSRWIRLDYAGLIISYKAHNYRASETLLDLYGQEIGRDGGIWTHDHLTPSQVRYQAALRPDCSKLSE